MARRLPSLNGLRAFEAAARHASFTLAACELNVSHAAISRHIRELEGWLGVKLFHRTGRGVELTEAASALMPELTAAFDQLAGAIAPYTAPARRSQLVISSEVPFAALWLVPRLGAFTALYPDTDLVVDADNRLVDFAKEDVDLGIRYGGGTWKGVEAVLLAETYVSAVCSPQLLAAKKIRTPADLAGATLIQEDTKQHWRDWLHAAGVSKSVEPNGPVLKGHLAIAAAEAGQGFTLADAVMAGDAVAAGRLVRPFDIMVRHQSYYLVSGTGQPRCQLAQAFRDWIVGEFQNAPPSFAAQPAVAGPKPSAATSKRRVR